MSHAHSLHGDGMAGSGDANSDVCATSLAMAGHNLRQPPQVMGGAHDVLARIPHGGAAQAQPARPEDATTQLAGSAYGRPANRVGGRRRKRDRREACSRWRAIGRLDVTSSRGGAIAEVASAVAERPRSRRRLAPLCPHRGACGRGDKRTPQQRPARCHRGEQDRDPVAHAGCLHATPSVCGGRCCDS